MHDTPTSSPPFFIVGVGRSGTTLLRLMLQSHPNIAIPYESHFLTDYHNNLAAYGDLEDDANLRKLVSDILNEELLKQWDHEFLIDRILPTIESRSLGEVFKAVYNDYCKGKNKLRWGDKSDYLDRMHLINEIFPDALFIHIIRDGRDVANSVLKQSWGLLDIIHAAEWWHEHVTLGRRMGAMLNSNRYIEVKFEDLVTDPKTQMSRLLSFIGEDYSDDVLDYHKHSADRIPDSRKALHYNADSPPKKDRVAAWKQEMSSFDQDVFSKYARKSLAELDYEIPETRHSKFRLTLHEFLMFAKRAFK